MKPSDKDLVEQLNHLLNWLCTRANHETGVAHVTSAQAPYGWQQRFDTLKALGLVEFAGNGWRVLDFKRIVTMEDLTELRRIRREARHAGEEQLRATFGSEPSDH